MTNDTDDTNVKQFTLNLVTPSADKDDELKDCLAKGLEVFTEQVCAEGVQSFFAIILDNSETVSIVAAGDAMPLKTLGALRSAENEILQGL